MYENEPISFFISADKENIDLDKVLQLLRGSYWAAHRTRAEVAATVASSLCFGAYLTSGCEQVGFARVVTDYADFAWLADVIVADDRRGNGIGKALVHAVVNHPKLRSLRRFMLATHDAHRLYERYGFTPLALPEIWMERVQTGARGA